MMESELAALLIGFILTLFVYSYLVGDNPLYRLAVHILVGVSAAYAAIIVLRQVILPVLFQIRLEPASSSSLFWLLPLLLAFFLLAKRLPLVGWLGNNTLALLVGVGAAVALVGAIRGTLLPQTGLMGNPVPGLGAAAMTLAALLTVSTLLAFQFTGGKLEDGEWKRPFWQRGFYHVGQAVLMITFGAIFGAVLSTAILLLTSRLSYFITEFIQLFS
jgi:hypothetical protein